MPRTKKSKKATRTSRKPSSRHEMIDSKTENLVPAVMSTPRATGESGGRAGGRWAIIVGLLLIVIGVFLARGGYIVAAMVNGKPIFGWDVSRMLFARFGAQTLESMISERLVMDAAAHDGVAVDQKDVDAKVNELVKSLGPNVKLEDLLKYQGMTKSDFESQVRLQLTVEKILGKGITLSDGDISTYIEQNRSNLTATDEAALREEAKQALLSQKVSEKIQPWFMELKQKASIVRIFK